MKMLMPDPHVNNALLPFDHKNSASSSLPQPCQPTVSISFCASSPSPSRTPTDHLHDHNLHEYEILSSEGLHDAKEHIKHIFDELPNVLEGTAKTAFSAFLRKEVGTRALVRGSDYRRAATKLPAELRGWLEDFPDTQQVINTLAEISKLLYMTESNRSPRTILRLYNVTFLHGLLCTKLFKNPHTMSVGQMFGLYFHKTTVHAAEDTRIVSGYSRLVEQDERQFKELRHTPTSGRPAEVAKQMVERLQVCISGILSLCSLFSCLVITLLTTLIITLKKKVSSI